MSSARAPAFVSDTVFAPLSRGTGTATVQQSFQLQVFLKVTCRVVDPAVMSAVREVMPVLY